ncbi:MAG TPA: aldehyde ferredoxin oxidoreductase N-terminal domain-containing protein [Bacteroidales bacterium]|jgi:glyceraldehyde-3-phosphate dehydrogenase (ferredoxin)|nr:aldehyde ferredoxin oxidoreductase N-terminal domain-containing protein [Bacteroidales bacterium]
MESLIRVLMIDASTGYYKMTRFPIGKYYGPVDVGFHLASSQNALTIGTGVLAGSILPGSNRMLFTGFSPAWAGFYVSSMGGAGLVFDNLGINMISIVGQAKTPSILYLNRSHGEEINVEIHPIDVHAIWKSGRKGIYSLMDYTYSQFGRRFENDPRILATGPASFATDFGAIGSAPIKNGEITFVDTWAGRGGFGSKMFQQHGLAAIIYGGTYIDEDFRDRKVADTWFEDKYNKKLAAKDIEATTKYRFDENFETGGTFGVNYATMGGNTIAFNYKSIYWTENDRKELHKKFIVDHYLKQFNEETIKTKQYKNCGEPCVAVCKKMNNEFKKDYEPYQTMGPLSGIFDQRAAELLNHHADMLGFDAISVGGVLSWIMECVAEGLIKPSEVGIKQKPIFDIQNFNVVEDSMINAQIGIQLLDNIINLKYDMLNLQDGARILAHKIAYDRGRKIIDKFVFNAFRRKGWMVPNQYWVPGALSPMPIMGKYYMYYGKDFMEPRKLGRENAQRFVKELMIDNMGFCRFHRSWAEEMIPEFIGKIYGKKYEYQDSVKNIAAWINSRNSSIFWESERNIDFIHTFINKKFEEKSDVLELNYWHERFNINKHEAAFEYWYEIHKGIHESFKGIIC